jgi:putative peptidoglycan lipid II flippase
LINAIATLLSIALLGACTLGIVGAPVLVYMLASGLKPEGFDAAVVPFLRDLGLWRGP